MRRSTTVRVAAGLALAAVFVSLTACGSTPRTRKQLAEIRSNPTPEVFTLAETPDDLANDWALYKNSMKRMFWEDVRRALYIDSASNLTPYPR